MTDTATKPELSCAHCGRPVSGRGAAPKDGKRYCAFNVACRNARDRAARKRRMASSEVPQETRPCSCCGAWMPPRSKRVTDHVLGRWCQKKICQQAKAAAISPAGIERARGWYKAVLEIEEKFLAAAIEPCPRCEFPQGRVGFLHRNPDSITGWCDAQGDMKKQLIPQEYVEAFGDGGPLAD